ncbi:hypothetical protein PENSTE_c013G01768 [Penicillium steckii]|uniref:MYND-type domain-containing protein n=1 Tax=Penicillium steckii TaxID=303698 RepID=A0A1V6T2Z0_9EURO|nr:hypothetical protein PENSTE_c013G01768 [Penicillium steckii]
MADRIPSPELELCVYCKKHGTKARPLKPCAKCRVTVYCSQRCQKSDCKDHKKCCAQPAKDRVTHQASAEVITSNVPDPINANDAAETPPHVPGPPTHLKGRVYLSKLELNTPILTYIVPNPFRRLKERRWMCGRPREDVYKLMIDAYRLRLDDDSKFLNALHEDTIYTKTNIQGLIVLDRFIQMAEFENLMPVWWNHSEMTGCIATGSSETWSSTKNKITIDDVNNYYGNPLMGLQLRIFGEQVMGEELLHDHLTQMLEIQVLLEQCSEFLNHHQIEEGTKADSS